MLLSVPRCLLRRALRGLCATARCAASPWGRARAATRSALASNFPAIIHHTESISAAPRHVSESLSHSLPETVGYASLDMGEKRFGWRV